MVFGPVAVTAYIAWWFIDTVDNWVKPWLPQSLSPDAYLPFHVPGFGVVIAIVGLTLLGFLTANIIGRSLVRFGEAMLDRMPVVRGVYKGLKQVFETIFSQSGSQFRKVGLVEFPVKGSWSIVFMSSAPAEVVAGVLPGKKPMISVFMPCTPTRRPASTSTSRRTTSSNCRFPPTMQRSSSCRQASFSRRAKRRSPQWRKRQSSKGRNWRRRRKAAQWEIGGRGGESLLSSSALGVDAPLFGRCQGAKSMLKSYANMLMRRRAGSRRVSVWPLRAPRRGSAFNW